VPLAHRAPRAIKVITSPAPYRHPLLKADMPPAIRNKDQQQTHI
uniref:Transcriptional regulator n=1 Tax=Globodera pallida TaxID=36090 RepID=A0A183CU54_GLOPA